jgi:hypothetical protein
VRGDAGNNVIRLIGWLAKSQIVLGAGFDTSSSEQFAGQRKSFPANDWIVWFDAAQKDATLTQSFE